MPSNSDDSTDATPADDVNGTVLSPEELDITEDQHVVELDDGRYLISPNEPPDASAERSEIITADPPNQPPPSTRARRSLDNDAVHAWMARRLEEADSRYGFDITAVFEGQVVHQELFSNDVITTFENLLVWYAQHVGGDTPVEDVLGILLAESTAPIRLPPNTLEAVVTKKGLTSENTIADLLEAVRQDGGLRFPSSRTNEK